jgi:hypothetical protein
MFIGVLKRNKQIILYQLLDMFLQDIQTQIIHRKILEKLNYS